MNGVTVGSSTVGDDSSIKDVQLKAVKDAVNVNANLTEETSRAKGKGFDAMNDKKERSSSWLELADKFSAERVNEQSVGSMRLVMNRGLMRGGPKATQAAPSPTSLWMLTD
ncbi:hypothetical protein Q7C36_009246 [Tachysurus vachellii]|uniref:Uncharacterized protein n=1 Tax=Tachysurus vachellii TaxID=175792 RepID=A0AA88N3U5_TACVA|nr:hypothetical protein Q7C36_009246 [Tachysurus vachellii]